MPMNIHNDSELIELLLQKERMAFQQAIRQYQPSMRALACRIVGDSISDEVVQEAWIAVTRGLSSFQGRSSLKTWILTIVANEAKMRLRKEKPTVSLEDLGGSDAPSRFDETGSWITPPQRWELSSPDEILSAKELRECIELTVSCLQPLQASTLQLRELENMNFSDICNILEISESNVRVLLHRARQTLYQIIEHFQSTGECKPCNDGGSVRETDAKL